MLRAFGPFWGPGGRVSRPWDQIPLRRPAPSPMTAPRAWIAGSGWGLYANGAWRGPSAKITDSPSPLVREGPGVRAVVSPHPANHPGPSGHPSLAKEGNTENSPRPLGEGPGVRGEPVSPRPD